MSEYSSRISAQLRGFTANESGATAIEYALMASGIALAIMSTIWTLGDSVKANLSDKLATMF